MLRDPRRAPRAVRHLAMLGTALVAVATLAGCGIKGSLKRADAPASASTAAPPTTTPDPTLPAK